MRYAIETRGIRGISAGSDGNGSKSFARETNRVQCTTSPIRYRTNPASVVTTSSYRCPGSISEMRRVFG